MVGCAVRRCGQQQVKQSAVRFFCIPSVIKNQCAKTRQLSERRRALWISRINRKDLESGNVRRSTRVCSKHFISGCPAKLFDPDNVDWAPTAHLGYENSDDQLPTLAETQTQNQPLSSGISFDAGYENLTGESACGKQDESMERVPDAVIVKTEIADDHSINSSEVVMSMGGSRSDAQVVEAGDLVECMLTEYDAVDLMDVDVKEEKFVIPMTSGSDSEARSTVADAGVQTDVTGSELNKKTTDLDFANENLCKSVHELDAYDEILAEKNMKIVQMKIEIKKLDAEKSEYIEKCRHLQAHVNNLSFHEDSFRNDDMKVGFFTGLPSSKLLMHVFSLVGEKIPDSERYVVSKFQQFIITLMRLRLGVDEQDLAYRFNVSRATINRIFFRWLTPLSCILGASVVWPDREIMRKTMPLPFVESFKESIVVIVDCFEVCSHRPSTLLSPKAGVWSQCKHNNTVKFLIGVTPQGTVSYISDAWVGETSNELLIERCGILDKLLPGDVVLADTGLCDRIHFVGASVALPASTKDKPRLNYDDVNITTRKIAHVRALVERVVGLARRKYKILSSTLPVEFLSKDPESELTPVDHIVRVCCGLVNMCAPVIATPKIM